MAKIKIDYFINNENYVAARVELVEGWVGGNPVPFHEASKEVCLKDSAKDCMTVEIYSHTSTIEKDFATLDRAEKWVEDIVEILKMKNENYIKRNRLPISKEIFIEE